MTDPSKANLVLQAFSRRFGHAAELYRAPGRINLIGEHTDYNDGFVMPMNTALFTWVALRPREDGLVRAHSALLEETVEFALNAIDGAGQGHWSGYLKGVLQVLREEGLELRGADVLIDGNLPLGGGLSSSASLETAVAVAFLGISDLEVDPARIARLCQRAENQHMGVHCGIMDQFVIAGGLFNHAMKLDCRSLESRPVALPDGLGILVTDTGVKHQLGAGEYNRRREACESVVKMLGDGCSGIRALRDVSMETLQECRDFIGETLYHRARHVVGENQRVHDAETAIARGDLASLGRIVDASHDSLRDDFEVSCAELDCLVAIARHCEGVYGSRMVGGGFGGCTITLADPERLGDIRATMAREYAEFTGRRPWQHVVQPAHPAGRVEP